MSADAEYIFLEKMFYRLSEVRRFRARVTDKSKGAVVAAYDTAELMISCSIKDYLEMKGEQK